VWHNVTNVTSLKSVNHDVWKMEMNEVDNSFI